MPCSEAELRIASISRTAPPSALAAEISSSTYHGWLAANGSRAPGILRVTNSSAMRGMNSNAVRSRPQAPSASCSRASASSIRTSDTNAVARSAGRGNSLSTAAVMMPSVPSAPISRFFRS
jgi:hypothetical protein